LSRSLEALNANEQAMYYIESLVDEELLIA
jgi:hypothetical protein